MEAESLEIRRCRKLKKGNKRTQRDTEEETREGQRERGGIQKERKIGLQLEKEGLMLLII